MWKMSMPTLHGSKQVWQSLKTKSTPTIQQAINSRILTFASSLNQYKHSTRRQSTSINNQSPDLLESLPCTCATIPTVERSTRRLLTWELTCAGTLGTSPIFAVGPAVSGDSPGQDILRKISFSFENFFYSGRTNCTDTSEFTQGRENTNVVFVERAFRAVTTWRSTH